MSRVPSLHRHTQATVHFSEPDHVTLSPVRSQDILRSPSMLLVSGPEPSHTDMQDTVQAQSNVHNSNQSLKPRPTQSDKAGGLQKKSSTQQQSEVRGRRRKGTPSRIPVKQHTATRTTSQQTQPAGTKRKLRAEQLPCSVPRDTPQPDTPPCRMKSPPVPALAKKLGQGKDCSSNTTTISPSLVRAKSPPVPALSSRLLQPDSQTHRSHSPPVPALASRLQPGSQTHRSHSPPVPALASRLQPDSQTHRSHSPPVPALTSRLQPDSQTHWSHSPPVPGLSSRLLQPDSQTHWSHSPPVPALASRLQPDSQTHWSHSPPVPGLSSRQLQPDSQTHRSHSPPVPALGSRLLQPGSQTHRSHSPPVPALASRLLQPDSQTHWSHSPPVPALASRLQPDSQTHQSHSPPVPALAKNLQTVRTSSQLYLSPPTQLTLPQLVEEAHSMPINRPPSCTLTTTPLLPSLPSHTLASTAHNVVTIPPHPSPLPLQGSLMTTNRQQTILQQLEMLRQVLRELCMRRVLYRASIDDPCMTIGHTLR